MFGSFVNRRSDRGLYWHVGFLLDAAGATLVLLALVIDSGAHNRLTAWRAYRMAGAANAPCSTTLDLVVPVKRCSERRPWRVTPAMEAGVSDRVWSLDEIIDLLEPSGT